VSVCLRVCVCVCVCVCVYVFYEGVSAFRRTLAAA